ncbi:MAG: glucose-1-phosphate thymidylyltransferase, partial [Solobacterium sp.]|nr:glucose-1-phosphate thymidylyltransferase [Solobacterium sp.]
LDTGTIESLAEAGNYVKLVEDVQGIKISVPEEIAFYNGWIGEEEVLRAAEQYGKSAYGEHLRKIIAGNVQTTYRKG